MRTEVEELQGDLARVQDTLEEWQAVQSSWLSLHAIFSSADIRKQLASEASKFAAADAQIKTIYLDVLEYNICLNACNKEGRLETLKKLSSTLDEVKRGLEDYLQVCKA